ncbi:hypothetical protein MNEG_8283 [Monoraphidium neglectum]|uniref:Arginine decarboxylase n=1 Tax=Monoraphidium neglectum TaxID=145388 RepID=A0A0D2N048_9CHLO|nr:hypothetical protein MNEG_8283 [Monoraphidium neglectum]KIY99675.1 hypothetical protein MNEG_8283 [Monoraphidium neglectum]|eukprot:XP_013898695.1 hypothetical protein MNEG_8283 [Monoraphidium neglectum]
MFMTGVYQEVMGSVHNMFGSLNTVVVRTTTDDEEQGAPDAPGSPPAAPGPVSPGSPQSPPAQFGRALVAQPSVLTDYNGAAQGVGRGFKVEHVVRGESVAEVLSRAHHHKNAMLDAVKSAADAAAAEGRLAPEAAARLVDNYAQRLMGYTAEEAGLSGAGLLRRRLRCARRGPLLAYMEAA